jgi:DNA-binding NarL/FixJ family response regulator
MTRILIACDEAPDCARLAGYFDAEDDFEVCAEIITGDLIARAARLSPDLAIIGLCATSELEFLKPLQGIKPDFPILAIIVGFDLSLESKALSGGALAVFQEEESTSLVANVRALSGVERRESPSFRIAPGIAASFERGSS